MADKTQAGYVIDVCAIGDLSGENRATKFTSDRKLEARIWRGIEGLIKDGRLVTSARCRLEMRTWCPSAYARLKPFGHGFFLPDTPAILGGLKAVLAVAEERTRRHLATRAANKEVADPYLICIAMLRRFDLVTSERARAERPAHLRRKERIPDWCPKLGVSALHLEDLVRVEGWA